MNDKSLLNHRLSTAVWGALLIWWGVSFLIDPITLGMSAVGTGLIFLGVNAIRYLNGIPTRSGTTTMGIIALAWGVLDQGLSVLMPSSDLSFPLFLIVIGAVVLLTPLFERGEGEVGEEPSEV